MIKLSSAKKYAKTLMELAQEKNLVDKFSADMGVLRDTIEKVSGFLPFLSTPTYDLQVRKSTFAEIMKPYSLHEYIQNFVYLLMEGNKVKLLPYVCKYYRDYEDFYAGKVRAMMKVPMTLDATEAENIKKALEKTTQKTVIIDTEIDKSVIGGIWVKIGDIVYDGTVRKQLTILKDNLLKG